MNPIHLKEFYLEESVLELAKKNRDRIDPEWSLADYFEHLVAMHEKVLDKHDEAKDES